MDAATTSKDVTVHKKKKMRNTITTNGGQGGEENDLISELPDPIIHHIFSYLDMTTVFQTSFLSKRWRYLWTTLPFLNFNHNVFDSCSAFSEIDMMYFVVRVLILRNHNSNIYSFYFSDVDNFNIVNHTSTWIQILIRSNIQEIDIHVSTKLDSFKFPISLFTCTCLTTLKLDFSGTGHFSHYCPRFELPVQASSLISCLPALKTLHLTSLLLFNYSFELLISKSPVLETLFMKYCILDTRQLNIFNPQIKSLTIERMSSRGESKTNHDESCEIKVYAPKLTLFSCTDYIDNINNYSFVNSYSPVKADIDIILDSKHYLGGSCIDHSVARKNAIESVRGICNVQSLMISAWLLERLIVVQFPEPFESLKINPFCNLRFLTLKTSFSKPQIYGIMYLLENCSNLEYLVLKTTLSRLRESKFQWEGDEDWEAELAPQCMMHHLRLVEIWDVVLARVNEFEFLKFLLKNAIVLEKMTVFTSKEYMVKSDDYNTEWVRGFSEKLKSFRRASAISEIFFI